MKERDLAILRHTGLYRITLRPVLERLFFGGKSCGAVLQRLRSDDGLLQLGKLPRRVSYYQLTPKAAAQLGLPVSRTTPFGTQALHRHLSILWFCCMGQPRRFRLEPDKLERLFPSHPPAGDHCVEEGDKKSRIYHLYTPDAHAAMRNVIREIRANLNEACANRALDKWLEGQRYSFAVLVETPERRAALRSALKAAYEGELPLIAQAYFRVEVVPGLLTIGETFKTGEGT